MKYKEPIYENVEIGESFGPITLDLDDFFLKSYAYATDDYTGMKIVDGEIKPIRIVPAAAIVSELMLVFLQTYDPNKVVGLHQKEEAEFFKAASPGTRLVLTGKYVDKCQKRGKGYVVLSSEARDEAGALVARQRSTEIMRMPEGVRVGTGEAEPERRVVPRPLPPERLRSIQAGVAVGTALAPLVKNVRQAQMSVFSGAEIHKQGIHTNLGIARKAGLRDCIAQGMMESCWAGEFLTRVFGSSFLSSGHYLTVYLTPVYPRETITCQGLVSKVERTAQGERAEIEYWLTNQEGAVNAVGYGSAILA